MEQILEKIEKAEKQKMDLKKEIRERTMSYIIAAFGLVVGLAWNDAIKSLIEYLFPLGRDTLLAKFSYAIFLTFIIVIISVYLIRFLSEDKKII